jgi:hypothetical protein
MVEKSAIGTETPQEVGSAVDAAEFRGSLLAVRTVASSTSVAVERSHWTVELAVALVTLQVVIIGRGAAGETFSTQLEQTSRTRIEINTAFCRVLEYLVAFLIVYGGYWPILTDFQHKRSHESPFGGIAGVGVYHSIENGVGKGLVLTVKEPTLAE